MGLGFDLMNSLNFAPTSMISMTSVELTDNNYTLYIHHDAASEDNDSWDADFRRLCYDRSRYYSMNDLNEHVKSMDPHLNDDFGSLMSNGTDGDWSAKREKRNLILIFNKKNDKNSPDVIVHFAATTLWFRFIGHIAAIIFDATLVFSVL